MWAGVMMLVISCGERRDTGEEDGSARPPTTLGPIPIPTSTVDQTPDVPDVPPAPQSAEAPITTPSPDAAPAASVALVKAGSMTIPTAHPRLWWNPERLARAKSWFAAKPFSPRADEPQNLALHYVLSGDTSSARKAITWLMGFTFRLDVTASDPARWHGEHAMLVFDWCFDQLTASERATLISRWNEYITTLNAKTWGGIGFEANNYYWGYFRNSFEWAVASYHENPQAAAILQHALINRWQSSFVPYASTAGRGGIPHEGSQYGRYNLAYVTVPLTTAALLGQNLWDETLFFREALYYVIYGSTPAKTHGRAGSEPRFEIFPYGDDEFFQYGGSAETFYFGDFLATAMERWRGKAVAAHARTWFEQVRPPMSLLHEAVFNTTGAALPFTQLPLDYFGAGNGYMYARTRWAPDTTVVNLQLGRASGVGGHEHLDWGTFQIWRAGRWLSRETTGYTNQIAGWRDTGSVDASRTEAHNGVLFDGYGIGGWGNRKGPPRPLRVESRADYAFAAVDLSAAYRNTDKLHPERDNPGVARLVREFVYIRPFEALVAFDRIETSGEKKPAASVVKTFLVHFEAPPRIEGTQTVLGTNGDQALRVSTLLPTTPSYRVVSEGGTVGQYRLEVDASGNAQGYFLHVLHARAATAPDLRVRLDDQGDSFAIILTHPTQGTARVVLRKGMESQGGSFGHSASGTPVDRPLIEGIQSLVITEQGPAWGD